MGVEFVRAGSVMQCGAVGYGGLGILRSGTAMILFVDRYVDGSTACPEALSSRTA